MTTTDVAVPVGNGVMNAYLAAPDPGARTGVGVLVFMEAFGLNGHIRNICDRLAGNGHVALAPDLYHRQGTGLTGPYEDPSAIMPAFASLKVDDLAADVSAAHTLLVERSGVARDRIAAIGFCLGGWVSFLAAVELHVAAAGCFYGAGIGLAREGSPLVPLVRRAGEIDGVVQCFYGAEDPHIPAEEREAVRAALAARPGNHDVVVYEGAGHGFFCDQRDSYRDAAATDAWERVERMLDELAGPVTRAAGEAT